jgi:hypothetical protein
MFRPMMAETLLNLVEFDPKFTYMVYSATAEDNIYHKAQLKVTNSNKL